MDASDGYDLALRRASLPPSPVMINPCPPSSHDLEAQPRRRSTSLSKVRDSIRRTSICIQNKVERKIVQLAEQHCDIPTVGTNGLVYHVPTLPGDHSRESVVQLLNHSVDWLRVNPDKTMSPFNRLSTYGNSENLSDLLDLEMECAGPTSLLSNSQLCGDLLAKGDPISLGIFTKAMSNGLDTYTQQVSCPPTPMEFYSGDGYNDKFLSLASPSSMRSSAPQLSTSCPPTQTPTMKTQDEAAKAGAASSRQDDMDIFPDRVVPPSLRPATSKMRRKSIRIKPPTHAITASLASPACYLGVGLRPINQLTPPTATLLLTPAPPATARQSREVLERRSEVQLPHKSGQTQRRLCQTLNDHDFRQPSPRQLADTRLRSGMLQTIDEQVMEEIHIPGSNSVAEKISRFEKPLPPLPAEAAELKVTGQLKKKGRSVRSLAHRHTRHEEVNSKAPSNPRPLEDFQPYHRTPLGPVDVNEPRLHSMPHPRSRSSLNTFENEIPLSPGEHCLRSSANQRCEAHLPYIPYSPSLSDNSSFEQLDGRVDRMRKQFEEQDNTRALAPPTLPKAQRILGLRQMPNLQHDSEDRMESYSYYAHAVSSITDCDESYASTPSGSGVSTTLTDSDDTFYDTGCSSLTSSNPSSRRWRWKRFVDVEWDDRERERRTNSRKERRASRSEKK